MNQAVMYRVYVERKDGFRNEAQRIFTELRDFVGISGLENVRYVNRYDIQGITGDEFKKAAGQIFSEPQSDLLYTETLPGIKDGDTVIAVEYLPGQYDQRADSACQCISLIASAPDSVIVRCARVYVFSGALSASDIAAAKKYLINPVDSREALLEKPATLEITAAEPPAIPVLDGFTAMTGTDIQSFHQKMGLAMDCADIAFTRDYFKKAGRNPTETEIRVLDTYWSDHCRHTTFNTILEDIAIDESPLTEPVKEALEAYKGIRAEVYAGRKGGEKPLTLMDMATIGAKILKKNGFLNDIEESAEINACSIHITVNYADGTSEPWLLMFKNETHNHPTEIEPFGGAATCIGGAIRDPLSGRSWVYQAMRITGAGDPRTPLKDTLPGKLPQLKLTREAAAGYSSYGNQIGLTTGQVVEIYDPGFMAKRMELGAVIAAVPESWVVREEPEAGDVVILLGGGTGRDGIGGATGSSKAHTVQSLTAAGAEVQKGNAVEERKIQHLFRNPAVTRMIRRCNDFGAGGVSVAIGELAEGLEINLDLVPKKYDGLNGTEIAISESQERMAVVVRKRDAAAFIAAANKENLTAVAVASVTSTGRLVMTWKGAVIVDIERSFLDTCGASRSAKAVVTAPAAGSCPLEKPLPAVAAVLSENRSADALKKAWLANLADLAVASQKGLGERFDGSIGAASVLFPFGGKTQNTPEAGMAARIPCEDKEVSTASIMTFGYDPLVASWSPFHGAQFAVLDSVAKVLALGGNPLSSRLTFQEYFEKTTSPEAWGKPAAAMLGALAAQTALGTAAIGGKDSMSGTFGDMHVPPTLVSIAVAVAADTDIRSGALSDAGTTLVLVRQRLTAAKTPDWETFIANAAAVRTHKKDIAAAYTVGAGGVAAAVSKMAFGNMTGVRLNANAFAAAEEMFAPLYGSLILEMTAVPEQLPENWHVIGDTIAEPELRIVRDGATTAAIPLADAVAVWTAPLSGVFPPVTGKIYTAEENKKAAAVPLFTGAGPLVHAKKAARPTVLLPVFPGTNCEYDMARAFRLAGADTKIFVLRNRTKEDLRSSLAEFAAELNKAQILALSGGFSAGDEPDGSGKYIANVLREPQIADTVMEFITGRDGLILGICNGFQALVKVGLIPYGKIIAADESMPTLTFNTIGRHISRIVTTRMVSALSPWSAGIAPGTLHKVPVSHGEGRIIISDSEAARLFAAGQIFTQYTDENGTPVMDEPWNPNGSQFAIEGMTSPDGRVAGKMGHSERTVGIGGSDNILLRNIPGNKCQNIFAAGVNYFK